MLYYPRIGPTDLIKGGDKNEMLVRSHPDAGSLPDKSNVIKIQSTCIRCIPSHRAGESHDIVFTRTEEAVRTFISVSFPIASCLTLYITC
jgi:hypothetical protein